MKGEFRTVSNYLSILRALLAIPFVVVMLSPTVQSRIAGCLIIAIGALTDNLDGVLARKLHQETEWGRILDPLADKIGAGAAAIVLVLSGDLPLWFVILLVVRDLLILAGGLFIRRQRGVVLPSNRPGKWAIGIVSLALFFGVIGSLPAVTLMFVWAGAAILVVSLGLYVSRFIKVLQGT
jgi:CDP-diacylglycerol--glycerol-3-phosphate 3-phosphatidyltransferase